MGHGFVSVSSASHQTDAAFTATGNMGVINRYISGSSEFVRCRNTDIKLSKPNITIACSVMFYCLSVIKILYILQKLVRLNYNNMIQITCI